MTQPERHAVAHVSGTDGKPLTLQHGATALIGASSIRTSVFESIARQSREQAVWCDAMQVARAPSARETADFNFCVICTTASTSGVELLRIVRGFGCGFVEVRYRDAPERSWRLPPKITARQG